MEGLSNNDRRLYKLCKEGNLREVKELIEETGKVAFVQRLKVHRKELWYVYTPLHEAAANGYKDLLSYLLELGCDVNCRSLGGDTPLHLAVSNGHVECIRALLKCNPDMRLRNNAGKTPWQVVEHRPKGCCIGSIMRSEEVVKDVENDGDAWLELLRNDPSLQDDCLSRALIAATKCDNPSNVGRLVSKGAANISEALQLAQREGKTKACAMLLLTTAAINNDVDLVRRLFGESVLGYGDELQEAQKAVTEGYICTFMPLEMASLRQNKSVTEELLLRTEVYQSEGTVYWHGLGLNAIESALLNRIHWVKMLHLGCNRLSIIPTEINLYLQQVVTLDIQHNELSTIPSCILELPNLTVLNISHNKLTIIPRLDRWSSSLNGKNRLTGVLETAANIASRFASKLQIEQVLAVGLDDPLEGVSELQDTIYHCAAAYKLNSGEFVMGQKIPVSYYKLDKHILWIQKQVRGLNHEPIMHHEEYKALVQELHLSDIGDDDELKMATLFLTDVGTLLHYGDYGHHLDELYFVDPKWLCDVMAKIVSVKEMNPFVQDGVLHTKDIPLLYHNEKFPWQYCQQYLTLLDRFEIAFALDRHRILIPSLLSEVPPDGMGLSEMNAVPFYTRLVIFNTSTMPSGFWSRLISRIMHAIPNITSTIHSERNASTINAKSSTSPNEHILASNPTQQSAEYSASFSLSLLSDFSALQGRLLYWRTGLFYENTHVIFRVQSLFETHHHKQGIEITASTSPLGRVIVGQVIDFIGTLVKDWYPGLEDRGPLEQTVLCCECLKLKRSNPHQFNVQDCHALINQNMTTIDCGYTKDPSIQNHSVPLADIVPDLLLQDISMKFLLNLSELEFSEGNDSVLGIGGFGKVFRGKCKGQSVAIKRYLNGNEALGELRKEAILLQKSYHPCLVGLVGVCVHPILALVLEEAPLGSLEKPCLKEKAVLHRIVVQRIAVQVAAALKFLHSGGIIFRDLKAANVLLWSLDPGSLCHCKVTDFGIATHITPLGTRGLTGTKGFIAPEVLHISKKKEHSLYDHKVDIFSFGMLLYQVISRRHPFHNIPPVKIDSAVECGERPTLHDVPQAENAYFYLTRLMEQCWQGDPRKRPTADEIIEKLSLSSFQSAMTVRPVPCSSFSLRTGCVVSAKDFANIGCSHRENELWVCSDGNNGAEISIYLTNTMAAPSKTIIEGNQVQCIGLCGEQIWIASRAGIGDGAIDIFSIVTREAIKRIHLNDQSVSCIAFFNKTVYCGTLDGFCLSFSQRLLTACSSKPRSKHISDNAVDGICATKDCLWLSYGNSITFINQDTLETVGTIKRAKYCDEFVGHLQINSSNTTIWSCLIKRTTFISAWDGVSKTHTFDINVKDYMNSICQLSVEDTIITAFVPVLDNVWVGIKSGHILVFFSKELLMWFHPYAWYVRFLLCIPCEGPCGTEKSMVISGGKGFRSSLVPGLCEYPEMSGVGTLIVWEAFSSKMSRQMSLLQSQSSTYLESHESVRDMIQRGEFEDSMFLAESSSHAPGVQDDQEKVASEAESITTDHI
eukprot:Em0022g558a